MKISHMPSDGNKERDMWVAVVFRAARDLLITTDNAEKKIELHRARAWIGEQPSPDFIEVCEHAGLPHEKIHAALKPWVLLNAAERHTKRRTLYKALEGRVSGRGQWGD